MEFGVCLPNYGERLSVEALLKVSQEAERLGFDSLWTTDHILMPKNSETPYERIFDSITSLAYLAGQTKKVKLGISSLIIAMRNPVEAAKQLATVDVMSGGRVTMIAIGAGWFDKEFSFLGSNFHDRGKRVDESMRIIRGLWKGESSFESNVLPHNYSDVVFQPKPLHDKISIWIGGSSPAAMKRAANLGDAWHPNAFPLDKFRDMVSEFRSISPNAKDKPIRVRIGLNPRATRSEYIGPRGEKRLLLSGNTSENREVISELEKLGVDYFVVSTSPDGKVSLQDQLEGLELLAKEFIST